MHIIETIHEMQNFSRTATKKGKRIGFVPTMGFLHQGHLSLIDEAHRHADIVVVSIFVNPTQFGPDEDLDKYPRDFERDTELCKARNVDVIFAPSAKEMYPQPQTTWVQEESLTSVLCGCSRPTHFRGVTTVVTKLFNAVLPDIAVFGEKDYQQLCVIRKMVADLNYPVEIISSPLVREDDGLAMSSRNRYLSADERERALSISRSLKEAATLIKHGEKSPEKIAEYIKLRISQNNGKIDYVEILDADSLTSIDTISGNILIAVAAFFGETRLFDNWRTTADE